MKMKNFYSKIHSLHDATLGVCRRMVMFMSVLVLSGLSFSNANGQCAINGVNVSSAPACNVNDAVFQVRAIVTDGSGDYDLIDSDDGTVLASLTGQTSNFVTFTVTIPGPTTAATINVDVVDQADPTCTGGTPVAVDIPECPECAITNVTVAEAPLCVLDNATYTVCADVFAGSGDYDLVDTEADTVVMALTGQADGNICFDVETTGPVTADTLTLSVRDNMELTCIGNEVTVELYDCPADCQFDTPAAVQEEILNYPHIDGKCLYLLVLEDEGGDGWNAASLDVSVAEAAPVNYKMAPADGNCRTIPIYVESGEFIDFTYWNGAGVNEGEHSFFLYDSQGYLAVDENGNTMAVGPNIPADERIRVKAQCAISSCNDETLELSFVVNGVVCTDAPVFWEIRDSNGDIVYNAGPIVGGNALVEGLGAEEALALLDNANLISDSQVADLQAALDAIFEAENDEETEAATDAYVALIDSYLAFISHSEIENAVLMQYDEMTLSDLLLTELNRDDIVLNKCERYMLVLGSSINTDWASLTWQMQLTDPRYGRLLFQTTRVLAGDAPAPGDFEGGMLMYDFTIPCIPDVPSDPVAITGADPATCFYSQPTLPLPLVQPVQCYPQLQHLQCDDAVTVTMFIPNDPATPFDDVILGSYNYDHLGEYSDNTGTVVDTNGDGVLDAVEVDYLSATSGPSNPELFFPDGGMEAGVYTICYDIEYNCEDFGDTFLSDNITVNDCIDIVISTTPVSPVMVCNDLVNISLNYRPSGLPFFELCQNEVLADQVLEDFSGCNGDYIINIYGAPLGFDGLPVNENTNIITATMAGGTYDYLITHVASGNACWGRLKVEDKQAPNLFCRSYEAPCNHPDALTLRNNNSRGYSKIDTFCIDQPQAIKPGTVSSNFANQLTGGNQIPFPPVGCTPFGEIIKKVELEIEVDHTEPRDLVVHLVPPVGSGVDTIRVTLPTLNTLSRKYNISYFFLQLINENPELYADFAGEWQLLITDQDNPEMDPCDPNAAFPPGYGRLIRACLIIEHGYPDPFGVTDCNRAGNPQLLSEELIETDCDQSEWYGMTVRRIWQASDAFGNTSSCEQTINLLAPTFDQIDLPGDASFECGEIADLDAAVPEVTGTPGFDCFDITDEYHAACDYSISYEDSVLPTCGLGSKIIRTWTFVAWCSGVTHTHEQVIKIEDTTGPVIDTEDVVIESTTAYDCAANVDLMSAVTDACSGVESITASYVQGGGAYNPNGTLVIVDVTNGELLENLPFGPTQVEITAKDSCLNITTKVVTIEVTDEIAPVAICDDNLHVSLGADGTARIYPEDFDEGSYDNCGDVTLKINNNTFFFRDFYEARCFDIGTVTLYLEVEDENGNTNTCWADVVIEDALPPYFTTCPDDVTLDCDDEAVHNPFGEAEAEDNCTVDVSFEDSGELDQCRAGTLVRTWTASDDSDKSPDATCSQRVTVEHVSDFVVQFPADVTITTCPDDLTATGEPQISDDDCELLAINHDDRVLTIVDDACYKIERTWTIVNWCIYEEGAAATDLGTPQPLPRTYRDDDGFFQWTQIIKVLDSDAPQIVCPGDQTFCDLTDGCEGEAQLTIEAEDECSAIEALEYTYKIDAFNDGTFDIEDTGSDATGVYPYGTHRIKWIVEDGCGNTSSCEYLFTIEDCKNPTPVCLNGISIENMQTGCVDVWAEDLLEYAFDNCSDDAFVESSVRIRREGELTSPQTSVTLCCEDVGTTVIVEIWVEDEAGNADYCTTYIIVQDNLNNCDDSDDNPGDDSRAVAGTIQNEMGATVEDVEVGLSGGMDMSYMTGSNGGYMFADIPTNNDYMVTPSKDHDPLNGVSTYDLVLISQHILGQNPLNSPYKMIAADVNNDGNITTFDVVQLRQLILFIVTDFTDNSSWRFVDAGYMFPSPSNPWMETFPEVIELSDLSADELANNFVAVKIGDVDGNAEVNSILGTEERTATGVLELKVEDTKLSAGDTHTIDFKASAFKQMRGYQFTLSFDTEALSFVETQAGALDVQAGNFGYRFVEEGMLTTSWNSSDMRTIEDEAVLFSVTFVAKATTNLSEVLRITDRYTKAEAYNASDLMEVALTFEGAETPASSTFALYQNQPNPFNGETVIGFDLPAASKASLTIYDVAGRILSVIEGDYSKGYNQVTIDKKTLNATGVLYYQLDTDSHSATRKMIVLD